MTDICPHCHQVIVREPVTLTDRELDVLAAWRETNSVKQAAARIGVSEQRAKNLLASARNRSEVHTNRDLVRVHFDALLSRAVSQNTTGSEAAWRIRTRTPGRFVADSALGTRGGTTLHNESQRGVPPGVRLRAEAQSPSTLGLSGLRVQHYITHRFRVRRKEPAPFAVVSPARHRVSFSGEEVHPVVLHVTRHPEPFHAVSLGEHHDVSDGVIL